mgnify:CR=1 FL=1
MAKIVMFWDCPYCRNTKIPGYTRECDGCGHPRPRGIQFYHSNPPTEATPEQTALFGQPDPNWYCEACDSGNRDEDARCWKCGTPRSGKEVVEETRTYHSADLPFSAAEAKEVNKRIEAEPKHTWAPTEEDPYNPQSTSALEPESEAELPQREGYPSITEDESPRFDLKKILTVGGAIVGVLALTAFIYGFFFKTHIETVNVTAMNWSRTVRIEEYQTFHEGGWSIPSGGRQTGNEQRKSGDRKVHDGYHMEDYTDTCSESVTVPDTCTGYRDVPDTCYRTNGDGSSDSYSCSKSESYTYSCSKTETKYYSCTKQKQVEDYHYEDIISTWYFYDIERWTTIGTYSTSGTGPEPYYDEVQPVGQLQRRVEDKGTYTVTFASDKIKPFTRTFDIDQYTAFRIEQPHEVVVNFLKVVLELR